MSDERMEPLCLQMCPESEIRFRNKNGLVHILETDAAFTRSGSLQIVHTAITGQKAASRFNCEDVQTRTLDPKCDKNLSTFQCFVFPLPRRQVACGDGDERRRRVRREGNPLKMVKQYSRSAAGKEKLTPTELRPYGVLMDTIAYLLRVVSEQGSREAWTDVYEFVSDRLRAVRQDMIVENLDGQRSVLLLESMIPFYLEAEYRCELTGCPTYDRKLHATQLEECFCRWRQFVDLSEQKNERIMASYLLHNADKRWVLLQLIKWKEHFCEKNYRFIHDVILSLRMNNFVRFFRLISRQDDELLRSVVARYIASIRLLALKACAIAYRCRGIALPEAFLEEYLHMSNDALRYCLNALGYEVTDGKVFTVEVTLSTDVNLCTPEWIFADFIPQ